ncbi:hypothetical protein CPB84DRAFT_1796491 [Gymnopilus junonius]|uniref:Uncharacterized protein n=1 Tax=Gymnopilus junonius TaxID=109634 RepID=A0A9P5N8X5_GYMJU|nr:hypothetical protein CPB84DRAFT_1796491 [Gymnopilus junonius]
MPNPLLQILDDNHGEFKYGGAGQWTLSTLVQWYQKTSNYPAFASSTAFGTFSLSFEGTSIAFVGNTPTNAFSQTATVSIDGGAPYNITYSTTPPPAYVQWYQSPTLSEGTHTVVVDHLDGTAVDYALIQVGQNTPLGGKTLVIDNDDPTVQFAGNWQRNTDQFNAGSLPDGFPLHNSTHRSSNPGDTFAFGFAGTSVAIYGILNWNNIGTLTATYTLDGNTVTQSYPVTVTSAEHISQDAEAINFIYFSLDNLSAGDHTLIVTITECQNSQYIFDYVTYTPSFSTLASMPNIAPVLPSSSSPSSSGTSSPSSPSQNASPASGSNSVPPTTVGSSSTSRGSGSQSGSASISTGSSTGSNGNSVRTSSNNAPVGAIVGGVVGGLVFLALFALLLFLIWKRRSRAMSSTGLASEARITGPENFSSQMSQVRGLGQSDGTVSPFQDTVGANPFNSGSIADLKRQRVGSSSNERSLGSTSPENGNATSSMDLEYMQDQGGPPAYDDAAYRRNTFRSR